MDLNWILGLIIGAILSGIIVYLFLRGRTALSPETEAKLKQYEELVKQNATSSEQARQLTIQLQNLQKQESEAKLMLQGRIEEKDKQISNLRIQVAEQAKENEIIQEKISTQKKEIAELQNQFKETFENLSNQILKRQSQEFREMSQQNLGQILSPLKENIEKFEKTVLETYTKETTDRAVIKTQIEQLVGLNQVMAQEAKNLTLALKGDSKTQGDWGETVLERLLEAVGMQQGKHYTVQENIKTQEGKDVRPDFIIKLPENRSVVVDCKVSLTAYERYTSATTEEQKEKELKLHIQSLRQHISALAEKRYQDQVGYQAIDFVVIFIPIEPALNIALQMDEKLHIEAIQKKILLASQTNLFAILRIILTMWRQQDINNNAQEMAKQAGNLYDKFVAFAEDMNLVGSRLKQAEAAHSDAMNKLSTGTGNLVKRAEQLKKLGATTKKEMPQTLLNNSSTENLLEESN